MNYHEKLDYHEKFLFMTSNNIQVIVLGALIIRAIDHWDFYPQGTLSDTPASILLLLSQHLCMWSWVEISFNAGQ